eukprot:TRINITY_DN72889_c0_g1_i1.p1 TRINITY_DN72889_c0_g1~~TRINITY_DN72889_c0_g1_i1.p1  ORF type:complete len:141 (+),score=12.34 TRINITY_DN72889_c0_g1_i1:91-513(+)
MSLSSTLPLSWIHCDFFWQSAIIHHAATIFSRTVVNNIPFPDSLPESFPVPATDAFARWANSIWSVNANAFPKAPRIVLAKHWQDLYYTRCKKLQFTTHQPAGLHRRESGPPRPVGDPLEEQHNGLRVTVKDLYLRQHSG